MSDAQQVRCSKDFAVVLAQAGFIGVGCADTSSPVAPTGAGRWFADWFGEWHQPAGRPCPRARACRRAQSDRSVSRAGARHRRWACGSEGRALRRERGQHPGAPQRQPGADPASVAQPRATRGTAVSTQGGRRRSPDRRRYLQPVLLRNPDTGVVAPGSRKGPGARLTSS